MLHSICPTTIRQVVFLWLRIWGAECGGEICKNDGIDRVALAQGLPGTACLENPNSETLKLILKQRGKHSNP